MKKLISIITILFIFTLIACNSRQTSNSTEQTTAVTVKNEATTADVDAAITTPVETDTTTAYPGIVPNTAGIVITAEEKNTEGETTTEYVPDEKRGVNDVSDNCFVSAEEDMEKLGVSKKVVFACLSDNTWQLDPAILSRFNELLVKEYGCDFVVELAGMSTAAPPGGYTYYDIVSDMRNMEQHVDIITASAPARYSTLVNEGFLMDITDYLNNTEDGQKLYDAYPEEIWEMVKLDGKIYGYTTYSTPLYTYALSCNREMAEKFGLKVEKNFTFYDIGEILEQAEISVDELGDIVPIFTSSGYLYRMIDSYSLGRGIFARKDADGNWIAFNATEDEEFMKLWKTVREYKEKGWLETGRVSEVLVRNGEFIFACNNLTDAAAVDNKIVLTASRDKEVIYDVIPGEMQYAYYGPRDSIVYGVTTWAKYPEEALKLITLMQTEEELCNLLRYGVEGEHYEYVDREVVIFPLEDFGSDSGSVQIVNPNLTYPEFLEPDNKLEFYKERCSNYEKDPRLDCSMSTEEFYSIIEEYEQSYILHQIYDQGYTKLINGEYEDVEAAVIEINRMQEEAGIDELINALNERFRQ